MIHTNGWEKTEKTIDNNESQDNVVQSQSHLYKLYSVIGTPLSHLSKDLKSENLSWFLDTFIGEVSMSNPLVSDIFEGFLQQTDLKHIKPEHLHTMLKEYIVQERPVIEPIVKANLKARCMPYNDFVRFLSKNNTNRLDLTSKSLGIIFKKSIMVIAEDYLWLSHTTPFDNFDLLFILFKGSHFASANTHDGSVIQCEMPFIKSFASSTNYCAENIFDHKILNRSDEAQSQLVEISKDQNCSDVKSSDVLNFIEPELITEEVNQAEIETKDSKSYALSCQTSTIDDVSQSQKRDAACQNDNEADTTR